MVREMDPNMTSRAAAYKLWMDAPNPMVTFFKTLDVTNLVKVSRRRGLKFNMLLDWCIGKAAAGIEEFYLLPVGQKLLRYDQLAVCTIGLVLFLANRDFVYAQLGGAIWAVRIGWLINFASVPLVLLAAFRRKWIQKLAEKLIRFGAKIRLVRDPEGTTARITEMLDTYHEALTEMLHRPKEILLQMICSGISFLGLTGSIVFAYYAFGQSGTAWTQVLTLSFLLFVSASYTPLPGASGAQEGGFLLYFRGIFRDGTIGLGLLIWRFFTYYLFLIVGVFMVIGEKVLLRKEQKGKDGSEGEAQL